MRQQQQRILRWQSANGKCNVGNAVVEREFILSGDWQEILDGGT